MSGPDTRGIHRVLWDLRYQFHYVPPARDSGFYGPPRASYVPPGEYTVKLAARGRALTQKVRVSWDPRGASTPVAMAARSAINAKGREISRVFYQTSRAIGTLSAEVATLDSLSMSLRRAGPDSAIADIRRRLAQIEERARPGVGSFPGQLFDLLASVESSSLPPTQAQERLISSLSIRYATIASDINDIITTKMPSLRARLGKRPPTLIKPIDPPAADAAY